MTLRRRLALPLLLALAGCGGGDGETSCNGGGGDNRLEGSYCEDVPMVFTEVRILKQVSGPTEFLRIEYVRPVGTGLEKTLSILFETSATEIVEGERIAFLQFGGSVRRLLIEGSINLTPDLDETTALQLDAWSPEVGAEVSGLVALSFTSGRKLTAYFDGTLVDAASTVDM